MTDDLFAAVRGAEEKAEKVVSLAQQAMRDKIKETEAACVEKERASARAERALYQSLLEEKRTETQKALDERAKAELSAIEAQMAQARAKLPEAVKFIAERVMNDGNR